MLNERPRLRELGLAAGILPPGPANTITDVAGVQVGHFTHIIGDSIRTGATAILPHTGNLFQEKTPAGAAVGNGFGKLTGSIQLNELGEIETPIVLTNTLAVPQAAESILVWTLAQKGNEGVVSINPVVGETNDSYLNDIRQRALTSGMILQAIKGATDSPPTEGAVGAGTGTVALGYKGGIGCSSRHLPESLGGFTLGALVQSNFGGVLQICGLPVGVTQGQYYLRQQLEAALRQEHGSIMIVLATDAPLSDRNLKRLAWRALGGLARTGASLGNGSGDYAIAFSTAEAVRRTPSRRQGLFAYPELPNDLISPLFQAAIEATEEAIYNSLLRAETMTGFRGRRVEALPIAAITRLIENEKWRKP